MFSYKLAKGTPLLEASWWKKRHGRSRSGLCKWSIKRAWNANKWTMAKCNIYTSFFSMLHTSFEVVVSLKVIFYPNGFLEKKNYAKTRPGSDFSTMSYRKGERITQWFGVLGTCLLKTTIVICFTKSFSYVSTTGLLSWQAWTA